MHAHLHHAHSIYRQMPLPRSDVSSEGALLLRHLHLIKQVTRDLVLLNQLLDDIQMTKPVCQITCMSNLGRNDRACHGLEA